MKRLVFGALKGGAFVLIFTLMLGWLQDYHPAFDSLSHFRLHFAVLLSAASIFLVLFRKWKLAVVSLATVLISLWLTIPFLPNFGSNRPDDGTFENRVPANFSVVQFNMRYNNNDLDAAIKSLRSVDADVYLLQELTNRNLRVFKELKKTHPYQLECISYVVGSVALASRHPFVAGGEQNCSRFDGVVSAQILVGKTTLTIASVHLRWPWPYNQRKQVARLKEPLSRLNKPLILAGDFNAAPWSHVINQIGKITAAKPMAGMVLSWSHRLIKKTFGIGPTLPIDHIYYKGLIPISRKVLAEAGSDHYPIHTLFYLGN
ncbi:MAG: endonuclease/exonuclease/phosphatase family protein [Rhizobiaceae bacterium]